MNLGTPAQSPVLDIFDLNEAVQNTKKGLAGFAFSMTWRDLADHLLARRALAARKLETETSFASVKQLQHEIITLDSLLRLPKDLSEMRQESDSPRGE